MNVILIEDDPILSDSYAYYFETYSGFNLVGKYGDVQNALDNYENTFPDIIISDISMHGISGIDGIKLFKKKYSNVKLLLISVHDNLDLIQNALENGADGYLTKPILKHKLYEALTTLKHDGVALSNDVTKKIVSLFQKKRIEMFSKRENDIVELLRTGETYKSIASKLSVSVSTVNFHIQNIYLKLNVNSKYEALKRITELKRNI